MRSSTALRTLLSLFVLLAAFGIAHAENPRYRISVTHGGEPMGEIIVELFPDVAPKHVHNFDSLVSIGFYDGTAFHRVIPGFMIQGGDPNSRDKPRSTWGYGDPDQTTVPAEFSAMKHKRGILSAARRGNDINSATSQFFICVATASTLDGQYSIYGQVLEGMNVVDAIVSAPRDAADNPIDKVEMVVEKLLPSDVVSAEHPTPTIETIPNPVSDELLMRYFLPASGRVEYALYNSMGAQVASAALTQSAGDHVLPVDVSALPPGTYYCRLNIGTTTTTGSFVVVR